MPDRLPRASTDSGGYATCAFCGSPLTDSEHFRGDICQRCADEEDGLLCPVCGALCLCGEDEDQPEEAA